MKQTPRPEEAILSKLANSYKKTTPTIAKLIDAYLLFILFTGIAQFAYVVVAGTFPFNAFLSGFISTVGSFVLAGKKNSFIPRENPF